MDIRTDYVRSLSSAGYSLELRFESHDGRTASVHLPVSRGICCTADGDMQADVIYLYPEQKGNDITVGNQSIYSAEDLDGLCDLLFGAAIIKGWQDPMAERNGYREKVSGRTFAIDGRLKCYDSHKELASRIGQLGGTVSAAVSFDVDYLICNDKGSASRKASKARQLGIPFLSDFDFLCGLFAETPECGSREDRADAGITVSAAAAAPITVGNFKCACGEAGITLANLKRIIIRNSKFGNRDSAMFLSSDNDVFFPYRKRFQSAPEEQKRQIAEDFIAFVKAGPVLKVNDNGSQLPETMRCIWNRSDAELEAEMRTYLAGGGPGHWMGTYSTEFTVDVAARIIATREVLFFGDI